MSCCSGDDDEEQRPDPTRVRECTDIFWLCCFIAFWFLMVRKLWCFGFVFVNKLTELEALKVYLKRGVP